MTALRNNAEGGTNGTTLTALNSGGQSGDAFDLFTGAPTFSNAFRIRGTMAIRVAGSASGCTPRWTTSLGTLTNHYGRGYFAVTAYTDASHATSSHLFRAVFSAAVSWAVIISDTGAMSIIDSAVSLRYTFSNTIALNTIYRLEWHAIESATANALDFRLYLGDDWTPLEAPATLSFAGQASINDFRLGFGGTTTNLPIYFYDELAVGQSDWPGPVTGYTVPQRMPLGV